MNGKEIARLEQQKFGKGKQSFVLHEDGTLLVTASKGGNLQHFSVSLAGWDTDPAHEKSYPKVSRVVLQTVSVAMCLVLIPMLVSVFFTSNKWGLIGMIFFLCVVFGILWTILYSQYRLQSYDVLIFRNRLTGGQLILHNDVPNEKVFSAFVKSLKSIIRKFPVISLTQTNTTVSELREFARLRDDGILTNKEFEEAKRQSLSKITSPSNMGFRP